MRILDSVTSRAIDKLYIEDYKMPSIVLMEVAALKSVEHIKKMGDSFFVIVGPGNNGGDGLAIARHLIALNKKVKVCEVQAGKCKSEDYLRNLEILKNVDGKIESCRTEEALFETLEQIKDYDVVIDSIFGTGLNRNLNEFYIKIVEYVNKNSKFIVSIDVPTGLDATTGELKGGMINANKTITFQGYKKGFLNYSTLYNCGEIIVEKLGVPDQVYEKVCDNTFLTTKKHVLDKLPKRDNTKNKGDFGKVIIIAGSEGFSGAAFIATEACVRTGAGLTTLATSKEIFQGLSSRLTEAMCTIYSNNIEERMNKVDTIAIGPGLGNNEVTLELLTKSLSLKNKNIIIDADAINVLKNNLNLLKDNENNIILTPHPGEFSRITNYSIEEINNNRIDVAREFAEKYDLTVLLKGYRTVIASKNSCYVNTTGNAAMANGGMGDCLTGIISALCSQKIGSFESAVVGAFIHGYIADELSKYNYVVNARDIIKKLPYYLNKIQNIRINYN